MVTFFVITGLAAVGLPMLSGFVGEFLVLSGTMQTWVGHHVLWTVVGTSGVIFSAAYMLSMIQRIFYGALGMRAEEVSGWDINAREHIELWPLAVLFLVMGIFSPYWTKAIDPYSTAIVSTHSVPSPSEVQVPSTQPGSFVDPNLGAAALGKQAPATNKGARY
jgi:NADH-quinone oxidoreductase subunit M